MVSFGDPSGGVGSGQAFSMLGLTSLRMWFPPQSGGQSSRRPTPDSSTIDKGIDYHTEAGLDQI